MELIKTQLVAMAEALPLLRELSGDKKNRLLVTLARRLGENRDRLLEANRQDVENYRGSPQFQAAFLDRLQLTEARVRQMQEGLKDVASFPDPVGLEVERKTLANGLLLRRVRSPLGLVFLIFESRPNVITEAFALAFKAGNGLILKGGKESDRSSEVIYRLIKQSFEEEQLPESLFWGLIGAPRELTDFLLKQNKFIDVVIPRGGEKLIEHVSQTSTIPIIKNDRGMCHVYTHEKANLEMALAILENAKTQRPSVCNAAETILVDDVIAERFLGKMHERLCRKGVSFFVCDKAIKLIGGLEGVFSANADAFDTEYLDLKLNVRVVTGLDQAVAHIEKHGSRHSEAIVTEDETAARAFQNRLDAAAVYWNASTRFTDGGQFGLGAEIGISTQKLHVRGPVGLEALTSIRWLIDGQGQVRQ